jgi:tetratricopeptide (TPR) repeat protein
VVIPWLNIRVNGPMRIVSRPLIVAFGLGLAAVFALPGWASSDSMGSGETLTAGPAPTPSPELDPLPWMRRQWEKTPSPSLALELSRALLLQGQRSEAMRVLRQSAQSAAPAQKALLERRRRVVSRQFLLAETSGWFQEGMTLLRARKWKAAVGRLEKAWTVEPDNLEVTFRLGQAQTMAGSWVSAIERFREYRNWEPEESAARLWLGRALALHGESEAAQIELRAAWLAMPKIELAQLWYAEFLVSQSQPRAALDVLDQAARVTPHHFEALLLRARLRWEEVRRDPSLASALERDLRQQLTRMQSRRPVRPGSVTGEWALDVSPTSEEWAERQKELEGILAGVVDLGRTTLDTRRSPNL